MRIATEEKRIFILFPIAVIMVKLTPKSSCSFFVYVERSKNISEVSCRNSENFFLHTMVE